MYLVDAVELLDVILDWCVNRKNKFQNDRNIYQSVGTSNRCPQLYNRHLIHFMTVIMFRAIKNG